MSELPNDISDAIVAFEDAAREAGPPTDDNWNSYISPSVGKARDALDAMIIRHLGGWQPISTAPRGELILVYVEHGGGSGTMFVALKAIDGAFPIWGGGMDRLTGRTRCCAPSWWMPLPAPPRPAVCFGWFIDRRSGLNGRKPLPEPLQSRSGKGIPKLNCQGLKRPHPTPARLGGNESETRIMDLHIARFEVRVSAEWQSPPHPSCGKAVALAMHPSFSDRAFIWFKVSDDGRPMRARRFIIVSDGQDFNEHARHVASAVTDEGGFHLFQMAP